MPRNSSNPFTQGARIVAGAALVAGLAACATPEPVPVASAPPPPSPELVDTMALVDPATGTTTTVDPLSGGVLYFAAGSADLSGDARTAAGALAAILRMRPDLRVRIAGHADDPGTPAENDSLAGQRAATVAGHLRMLDVGADRIEVVSYGQERPVALGDDDAARARNRRVEVFFFE